MASGSQGARRKNDNRKAPRARRRLKVRYGIERADKTAFTSNISETGVFVRTNSVLQPGTTLNLEIEFPDRTFSMWGRVMWAKKVPPSLAHVLDCGMGITFIEPPADWFEYFEAWKDKIGLL